MDAADAMRSRLRQLDHEPAAAALPRLAPRAAAVALGDLLDQGEAEADAAGLLGMARQAKKRLKDALPHRFRHARAAIADADHGDAARALAAFAEADLDRV